MLPLFFSFFLVCIFHTSALAVLLCFWLTLPLPFALTRSLSFPCFSAFVCLFWLTLSMPSALTHSLLFPCFFSVFVCLFALLCKASALPLYPTYLLVLLYIHKSCSCELLY